ncbi:hypothetical protein QFC20_003613 [Naganishia adeliensis]|uniref:Uncharacterized protein n=1 Tax=Naganishia adeliensis TaxID=92952 RepID=A0ACC2WA17_9TREE|nr:hypothetical protein QFC20_003613 [Naganishia adeliensis]
MAHEALCAAFDPPASESTQEGWSKNFREAWLTEHPESTRDPNGPVNDLPSQLVKNKDLPDLEAEYQNYLIGEGRILEETSATSIQSRGPRAVLGLGLSADDSSAGSQKAHKWKEMAAVYESLRLPDTLEAAIGDDP